MSKIKSSPTSSCLSFLLITGFLGLSAGKESVASDLHQVASKHPKTKVGKYFKYEDGLSDYIYRLWKVEKNGSFSSEASGTLLPNGTLRDVKLTDPCRDIDGQLADGAAQKINNLTIDAIRSCSKKVPAPNGLSHPVNITIHFSADANPRWV